MKKCPECGRMFKNLGVHMRVHKGDDDAMRKGEEVSHEKEATEPQGPVRRKPILYGGAGVIMR